MNKHGMDNMEIILDKSEKKTTSASVILSCSRHLKERFTSPYLGLAVASIASASGSTSALVVGSLAVVGGVAASRLLAAVVSSTGS